MIRYFFSLLLFFPGFLFAQRPSGSGNGQSGITGSISGILTDSISGDPVSYASIGILDQATGKVVNGSISDEKGKFKIAQLPLGTYLVQVSFIGYALTEVRDVRLTPRQPDADIGTLRLQPESQLLDEIRVVGEAALIEAKPDKIVYNAERDVTSRGGDAADVLRKVPLLAVDFDGNVSMRGSENVRILINGRPSSIFNSNVADALKMMPADQIKSVEVITSPSARYDGEGTAGIINIVTRKKNIDGLAGSADVTGGTRMNRGNINVNYGKGRLGLNLSGGGHYNWPQEGSSVFRREEFGQTGSSLLLQEGSTRSDRLGFRTQAGLEYNVNAYSSINSSFSYRGFNSQNDNNVISDYQVSQLQVDAYQRVVDGMSLRSGWDWELDYRRTFPKKDKEWSVAIELDNDQDRSETGYEFLYSFPSTQLDVLENNINLGDNLEMTVQTDYTHPFSEKVKVETGVKATLRGIESDFNFNSFDPDLNLWIEDPEQTDVFHYDQDVYAGYLSSTIKAGEKTTIIGGLRLEVTDLAGYFDEFNSPFQNRYTNVLPNLTFSRKMGQFNQFRISYNQRIQRPNQRHVNPFIEYSDNRDISFGNPTLTPELVHQIEVGTNIFIKGSMLNISVFGRQTEDLIENLLRINEQGVSETTFQNFGNRSALGMNLFGSLSVGKKLTLRGGFDVNLWRSEGQFAGAALSNTGWDYSGRLNATWTLTETLKMEAFTFFRSPTFTVQGKNPNWRMFSFGIKKDLLKDRMTLGLNVFQPFSENMQFIREISGDDFYQYSRTSRPMRSVGINLGYRFGKIEYKERSGRKKVNNNDLKEDDQGGDGQFQG